MGQVGTGYSATTRRLFDQLQPLRRNHLSRHQPRWVARGAVCRTAPFVAEIAYREHVPGRWLRHASFKVGRDVPDLAQVWIADYASHLFAAHAGTDGQRGAPRRSTAPGTLRPARPPASG